MSDPTLLQERLKYDKNIVNYSVEEMHYLTTKLGQAAYNQEIENEPNPVDKKYNHKRELYAGLETDDKLNLTDNPYRINMEKKKAQKKREKETGIKIREFTHEERFPKRDELVEHKRKNPKDKVKCDMCGKIFTRCNRASHNRTQYHRVFVQANKKLMALLQPDDI